MYVVDTNVLIYAANSSAPQHAAAKGWLTGALNGGDTVGFPWVSVLGFLRLTTNPRVMPHPVAVADAVALVRAWLMPPNAVLLDPGPRHIEVLADLLTSSGTGGNLTTDAHIAALALETGSPVVTFDHGFARFGVAVVVPTVPAVVVPTVPG